MTDDVQAVSLQQQVAAVILQGAFFEPVRTEAEIAASVIALVAESIAKDIDAQLSEPWVTEYTHEEQTGLSIAARLARQVIPQEKTQL